MGRWARVAIIAAALFVSACESRTPPPKAPQPAPAPAASTAAPQPDPSEVADPWTRWATYEDDPSKTYRLAPFTVQTTKAQSAEGDAYALLTISAEGAKAPLKLRGPETGGADSSLQAEFGAFALDPKQPHPQLLVRFFSFGAHCCYTYHIVELRNGRWKVHDLGGGWDDAGSPRPEDVDGDGRLELVGGDQAFLYAFEGYAGSLVPLMVWTVSGGRMKDASTDPRFRRLFADSADADAEACRTQPLPGTCLAYAATMARLGRLNEAWPLVERADPGENQHEFNECWGGRVVCVGPKAVRVKSFREKVERFLDAAGYMPKGRRA